MARGRKNPQIWAAAFVASSLAVISYKIYQAVTRTTNEDSTEDQPGRKRTNYTNKSIALTLLHTILNSDLPLNEILMNSENVTFILPPYLSVDDLACNIHGADGDASVYALPRTLIKNYKLLKCLNIQGYFHVLKNLKPDMLFVCSDDLGITLKVPPDLGRFVKEIITIDQNKDDVHTVLSKVFL
ncbi:CIC11C00000005530 [Sungouiella intermedia]|uniref:Peroxisome assembly protein 22 n=1 Tax=Sungouiella intermedia TaxID=45354 RepID=A0A1L0BAE6_9ASCO|nr:CIC11C00000005530 [[Candida] intermedia]